MNDVTLPCAIEPDEWFVVFHPHAINRWLSLLACGHFKHVSAFAYCPGIKAWLLYDAQWSGLRLILFPHATAAAALVKYTAGCAIVKAPRRSRPMGLVSRLGFFCVPAVKHLLGVRCPIMRPDALYRHLLRNGGTRIDDKNPVDPGRSQLG